jgi:hypothetical protein
MLSASDLRQIHNFTDAINTLYDLGAIGPEQWEKMTGFGVLPGDRKKFLVGVPFVILQFEFKVGKLDSSFVDLHVVTTTDERMIVRDSSRGIHEQLKEILNDRSRTGHPHPNLGIYVRKGLSFRENPYEAPDGTKSTSITYYLNGVHYSVGKNGESI